MSAALSFAVALTTVLILSQRAPVGAYLGWEEQLLRSLRQADDPARILGPEWFQEVARDLSALGGAVVVILMSVLVLAYLLIRRAYNASALLIVAVLGGYLLSAVLKETVARERPMVVPHLAHVADRSFPSGHSMLASVVYLTLGALLAKIAKRKREKIFFVLAALLLSLLVGASRVLLGVHYPTDVLAGWGAGTAWALACWSVAYRLQQRGALKTDTEKEAAERNALTPSDDAEAR